MSHQSTRIFSVRVAMITLALSFHSFAVAFDSSAHARLCHFRNPQVICMSYFNGMDMESLSRFNLNYCYLYVRDEGK